MSVPLLHAASLANSIRESLLPLCERAEVAGSIRRKKESVKDIELVLSSPRCWSSLFDAVAVHADFIKPGTHEIIPWSPKPHAKYLRALHHEGMKIDIFIGDSSNWAGLFMMRTGSGVGPDSSPFTGFTPAMFARWKAVSGGGRMCGCIPTLPDGRGVILREEKSIFDLFGVQWVPPERRAGRGDLKKIVGFKLDLSKFELK